MTDQISCKLTIPIQLYYKTLTNCPRGNKVTACFGLITNALVQVQFIIIGFVVVVSFTQLSVVAIGDSTSYEFTNTRNTFRLLRDKMTKGS